MTRRSVSRVAPYILLLAAMVACGDGDPLAQSAHGWVTVTDEPSGVRIALPEGAHPSAETAADADGSPVALRQYAATAAGGAVEVGFTVLDTEGGSYDLDTGVREVASSLHGQVVSARPTDIDGHAALDVEVSYGSDNIVLFQLVEADDHVLQPLVAGPASRRDVMEKTYQQLTGSLDIS